MEKLKKASKAMGPFGKWFESIEKYINQKKSMKPQMMKYNAFISQEKALLKKLNAL